MVQIKDLPLTLKLFMRAYRWRSVGPLVSAARTKPLSECTVAIVSSAGLVPPGDKPFDPKIKGGDWSWREIPGDTPVQNLGDFHTSKSYDHSGVEADRNMGFPLDRLHELADDGYIGTVASRHFSLMGAIMAPGRFLRDTVPKVADLLAADNVDVAIMVPV